MDENLPEKTPDADLSPADGGSASTKRELAVAGGEVYLPASRTVRPEDGQFRTIVTETLPEIAPSLSDTALGHSRGYSVAAIILILIFLSVVFALLYTLAPRPVELTGTAVGVPKPKHAVYSGRFAAEFGGALEQIKNDRLDAARKMLEPPVDRLLNEGDLTAADDNIFYAYFSLFDMLGWDHGARKRLEKLIGLAPDEYRWQLFDILSHPALARGSGGFSVPDDRKLEFTFRSIAVRKKKIAVLRRRHPELAEQLDLYDCYLAVNLWRLKNYEKRSAKVGEEDRERAWSIAKRYGGNRDFLNVRRYIVVRMLNDCSGKFIGRYKFDDRIYYSKTRLIEELVKLRKKLKKH